MAELVALALAPGQQFVDELRRAWDHGDAVFPLDLRLPAPAQADVLSAMAPARIVDASGTSSLANSRPVDDGDALVVATSGSTGVPKGVVLTHDAARASALAVHARLGVDTASDRWLCCLPVAHVGGLGVIARALITGTSLTVQPAFDADDVMAAAHAGCTLVSLVPTALARVDASAFRTIVLGGSRVPDELPANVVTTYGMTETGSGVVYDGWPLDGVEVCVSDDGEINLRAPMLLRAYRDGEVPIDAGGWFATGDLGGWLDDGRLRVDGRRGDMIVTGGEKVWPEAVEAILSDVTGISDVAITGVDDDAWGQRVVAIVVPTDAMSTPALDTVRAAVKERLAPYCAPRQIVVVDHIERTALGKIRRDRLPRSW